MFSNPVRLIRRALNRAWFVFVLLLAAYTVASFLYALFEHASIGDGLWWAVVTGTTTGYGDFYPITVPGRITAGIYMFMTMILNAFIIGHVVGAVIEDKNLFSHVEQEQLEAVVVLMGVKMGVLPAGSTSYPSTDWLREQRMSLEDNSS